MKERISSAVCCAATTFGVAVGFFSVYCLFDYGHEAGIMYPLTIGLWAAVALAGLIVRGKML